MKRCPRCTTSMILEGHDDNDAVLTADARVGKRLGCGREFLSTTEQTDTDQRPPRPS